MLDPARLVFPSRPARPAWHTSCARAPRAPCFPLFAMSFGWKEIQISAHLAALSGGPLFFPRRPHDPSPPRLEPSEDRTSY